MPVRKKAFTGGRLYRTFSCPTGKLSRLKDPPPGSESEGEWCMVNSEGQVHRLPKTMIFLGREECDIELPSQAVDKRHAVVTFDHYLRRFKIKDLSTDNGTYVNDTRIPEQEYVTLEHQDSVRLGNDPVMFHIERLEEPSNKLESDGVYLQDEGCLPSWASTKDDSESHSSQMAECKGCIVEQRIEHTCGEGIPESETAHRDLDRSYSHDSIATYGLGCNTWPRKRHKNKKHVAALFDMEGEIPTELDVLAEHRQRRVLRGTGAPMNNLPPELETVKKGTPLYGQPDWWGEDTQQDDLNVTEKLRSNSLNMDIPRPEQLGEQKTATESRNNVSNSVSDNKTPQNGVTDSENVPKEEVTPLNKAATPEGSASMAFTVDFGDDDTSNNMSVKRLSEFVPTKIRKSFKERMEKSAEKRLEKSAEKKPQNTPEKTPEKATTRSSMKEVRSREKESGTVASLSKTLSERAVSEGRDISPTRQRKIDDLWNSANSTSSTSHDTVSSKRARMLGRTRSTDNDDSIIDRDNKGSRSVKRRPPVSASLTKPKTLIRVRGNKPVDPDPAVPLGDTAAYLIDRMFHDSNKSETKDSNNTEYALYTEAKQYNNTTTQAVDMSDSMATSANQQEKVSKTPEVKSSSNKQKSLEVKQGDDNISETGTYTIEQDGDSKEEDEARKNIDVVFGVDQVSKGNVPDDVKQLMHKKPDEKCDREDDLALNLQLLDNEYRELDELERLRAQRSVGDSLDVDVGSLDREDEDGDEDNPSSTLPDNAPKWVGQWAALTTQKSCSSKSGDMELSSPGSSISDDKLDSSRSSTRGHNGLSRKRPGTGRKLPSIPPVSSQTSAEDADSVVKESPRISGSDLILSMSPSTVSGQAGKTSSHVSSGYNDQDFERSARTNKSEDILDGEASSRGKYSSNGSVASMDTNILLKDTETVMAAMEARVGTKDKSHIQNKARENGHSESVNLDETAGSDSDSLVALVNGDDEYVKPSYYKSPREALSRGKLKLSESLPSKPIVNTGGGKLYTRDTTSAVRKRSVEEQSSVSDIYSEISNPSPARSSASDSTDPGPMNRQGSKGKGQMSMTRPNRAFQLRRARADGDEVIDTPRSVSTASSSFSTPRAGSLSNIAKTQSLSRSQKPKRPMSGKFSDRKQDSARTEVSLGAQIVQRSRDNTKQSSVSSSSESFHRTDGGRHSLRLSRTLSIPQQSVSTPQTNTPKSSGGIIKARRSDVTNSSSTQIRHSSSLRVTGVSARSKTSSTGPSSNRSTSPKSAERNAWKRRKDYDPRRAVAEAKSKVKDTSKKRDTNVFGQRVTRSASFTNTRDLNLKLSAYQTESVSSNDDLSHRSSETCDLYDDGPRRGFVPYSNRSVSSHQRYSSSADEDDLDRLSRSTQVKHIRSKSAIRPLQSAFTPPPGKSKSISVFSPTPILKKPLSRSTRVTPPFPHPPPSVSVSMVSSHSRRSMDSLELYQSALGSRKFSESSLHGTPEPVPVQSYDTIIVSSIYQLSLKLKTSTDRTLEKLSETERIEQNGLGSPLEDLENQPTASEIPAYKSANQELAGVLKNLRKLEQHVKVINKALFPDEEHSPDTSREKHEYLQQIERIRNELAGFQPIENPREEAWKDETVSIESDCEELGPVDFY